MEKQKTYAGWSAEEFRQALDDLVVIEDKIEMTEQEQKAMDIAIQVVSEMNNCIVENREVMWDDEDEQAES